MMRAPLIIALSFLGTASALAAEDGGCDGIRKSMKYETTARPFVIQVSGVKAETVGVTVRPSD